MDSGTTLALVAGLAVGAAVGLALPAALRAARARKPPSPQASDDPPSFPDTNEEDSSEQRYQDLYDTSPDLYLTLDPEGRITDANRTTLRKLGLARDEVVRRPFADFLESESRDLLGDWPALLGEVDDLDNVECRLRGAEGTVDTILNFRVRRQADGGVEEIRAALRDVTRRKKLQRQLVQTERLATTGRLAASVAHEINNPLQALLMHLSMVEEALPEEFPERDSWERIQQGIRRVNQVVQDLLDLHRVERARRRRVDLNKLVREALGLARPQLDASRVQTQVALEPGLPWVPGDPQHLYQIVLNLVLNGAESMPSGGALRVVTRSDSRNVTLEFQDTGRGIPSEELSTMFNPFFTRRGGQGTGFGLFVTYSLVKEHHGTIDVEGRPGEGAVIRVRLPREEAPGAAPAGPSGTAEA